MESPAFCSQNGWLVKKVLWESWTAEDVIWGSTRATNGGTLGALPMVSYRFWQIPSLARCKRKGTAAVEVVKPGFAGEKESRVNKLCGWSDDKMSQCGKRQHLPQYTILGDIHLKDLQSKLEKYRIIGGQKLPDKPRFRVINPGARPSYTHQLDDKRRFRIASHIWAAFWPRECLHTQAATETNGEVPMFLKSVLEKNWYLVYNS